MSLLDYLGPRRPRKPAAKKPPEDGPHKWRTLKNADGQSRVIYGYKGGTAQTPRWFGYTREELKLAPCRHCGRSNVFSDTDTDFAQTHDCPGEYGGHVLPCKERHPCTGRPSLSWHGCPMYAGVSWTEEEE